ncbi:PAC2 family protein [Corynebacterium glyciniphilum]|uniref:PAC2 family protein n=1 Tax=Corynebacterium glyciniphilum TaxID=1404244 RepID=UPI002655C6D1|nr:PAC2 family protein [Corynebacterium glyciniphilum]MDN5682877.1 PAC2 family protein [Corynebacterium glyciniphilum]MDN6705641.1 PAC2 family protein [Corynebacterium glyciniphilum]
MSDSNRMYELEYPGPSAQSGDGEDGLSMVIALQGYADAGQGVRQASQHLLQALDHSAVATFNVDELIDYRSRRPGVTLDHGRVVDRENLTLTLYRMEDSDGQPFMLLSGPEPDLRWEAFSRAVAELASRSGVDRVVTFYAAPMTVPHTRPLIVTAHGSDSSLTRDLRSWESRMIIPGSAMLDVELLLSRGGLSTLGLTAHVPHYIAASDYPEAAYGLLHTLESVADLNLPLRALEADMDKVRQQLADQVDDSAEIASVVGALERQYDEDQSRQRKRKDNALLAPGQEVPSGEEISAEVERFLASAIDASDDGDGSADDSDTGDDAENGQHPTDDDPDNRDR